MTREEIIRNLKYTMEKHKNDIVRTFNTNISVMCKDILDYLEQEPCEDAVSRKAVHYMLEHVPIRLNDKWFNWLQKACLGLAELPSVTPKEAIKVLEPEPCEDIGEISDGYHTFNQLYHQRAVLFATIVNQNKSRSWKSYKHSDGQYCFDSNGEWFIVGIDTPQGTYTYHYSKEYWNMFDCQELEYGKKWDGHTEEDVIRLLSLQQNAGRAESEVQDDNRRV